MVLASDFERGENLVSDFYPAFKNDAPVKRRPTMTPKKRAALKRAGKVDENFDESKENQPVNKKVCTASAISPRTILGECNARPPTDFSNLFKSVRQSQGNQSRDGAMTNFEDIAAVARPVIPTPREQFSTQLTALLRANVAPEAADERSRSKIEAAKAASSAARTAVSLQNLELPPLDWSLKTSLRFASQYPFQICQQALQSSADCVARATSRFTSQAEIEPMQASTSATEEEWHQSLLSWQHPETAYDAAVVALLNSEKAGEIMQHRRLHWQAAFHSLYYALRTEKCRAFYLISPKGTRNPFIVLFQSRQTSKSGKVTAFISRSTRGMRAVLQNAPHCLAFSMPLAPAGSSDACSERHTKELLELGQVPGADSSSGLDNKPASLLKFEGPQRVHGIYNWLLDSTLSQAAEAFDVPQLMAPSPFLGASLHKLQPQIMPRASLASGSADSLYRLVIQGNVPPWVLTRICCVLGQTADSRFQALLETDALSSNLNVGSPLEQQPNQDCDRREENLLWRPSREESGLYTRELIFAKGAFAARMLPA